MFLKSLLRVSRVSQVGQTLATSEAGHAVANGHYILRLNTEGGVQAAQRVLVNR